MAQTNPNHPWVGGPPYVNTETGETSDMPPDEWREMAQVNPNVLGIGKKFEALRTEAAIATGHRL
jgi:hypothetical protein